MHSAWGAFKSGVGVIDGEPVGRISLGWNERVRLQRTNVYAIGAVLLLRGRVTQPPAAGKTAEEPAAAGEVLNVGNDRASTFLEVARVLQHPRPAVRLGNRDLRVNFVHRRRDRCRMDPLREDARVR